MDTAITFSLTTTSCPHRVNKGSIGTHTTAQNVKVLLELTLLFRILQILQMQSPFSQDTDGVST